MKIICPVCGQEGTLQQKTTVTKSGSKRYEYKKLYCRHTIGSKRVWHYLTPEMINSLGTQVEEYSTQRSTQNNPNPKELNSSSISQDNPDGPVVQRYECLTYPQDTGRNGKRHLLLTRQFD